MFQFSGFASLARCHAFSMAGCPIRKSWDIMCICHSPKLIAAYHVLLRLQEPRHPPYALNYFLCLRVNTQFFYTRYNNQMSEDWFARLLSVKIVSLVSFYQYVKERIQFKALNFKSHGGE